MTNPKGQTLNLVNILTVSDEIKEKVRLIRNEENVKRWMYSDHVITEIEHLNWLKRLSNDASNKVYVVVTGSSETLGVISINYINTIHERAEWAYYLSKDSRSGIGAILEYEIINYIFDNLNIQKLNCEVIEGNDSVISLHTKFGFQPEGFRRSNIIKSGERLGVHFLGITKEEWAAKREFIRDKYNKLFSKYVVVWN
jgi:UDP-4-amino-4,6-dideoxy-N-acetyl-beta-L-altrosamine N-acetyltransferase